VPLGITPGVLDDTVVGPGLAEVRDLATVR
jgi:hypothetical protein